MKEIINNIIRQSLIAGRKDKKKYFFKWKTFKGKILPCVTLDDRDSLFDLMDSKNDNSD